MDLDCLRSTEAVTQVRVRVKLHGHRQQNLRFTACFAAKGCIIRYKEIRWLGMCSQPETRAGKHQRHTPRNLCHQGTRNREASTAPTAGTTGSGPAHTQLKARRQGDPPGRKSTSRHCSASARSYQTRTPNLVEVSQKQEHNHTHTYSATPSDRCACGGEDPVAGTPAAEGRVAAAPELAPQVWYPQAATVGTSPQCGSLMHASARAKE